MQSHLRRTALKEDESTVREDISACLSKLYWKRDLDAAKTIIKDFLKKILDTIYNTIHNKVMAQWDKLLDRIKSLDKDMRFAELKKVLQSYGYSVSQPKRGSSHYTFRKGGCNPITIPNHEPIKVVYVKMVKEIVESEESDKKNED